MTTDEKIEEILKLLPPEHRRIVQGLARRDRLYYNLERNLSDVVVVVDHPTLKIVEVTKNVKVNTGYSDREIIGKDVSEFMTPESFQTIAKALQRNQEKLKTKKGLKVENMKLDILCAPDFGRETYPAEARASAIYNPNGSYQFAVLISDITERLAAEEALRQSEERHRILTENSPTIMWRANPDLSIADITPSCEKILGYTPKEMKKMKIFDLLADSSRNDFNQQAKLIAERLSEGELVKETQLELKQVKKDGTVIDTQVNVNFIYDPEGKLVNIVGNTNDAGQLLYLSTHDPKTGLLNERKFNEQVLSEVLRIDSSVRRGAGLENKIAVIFIDIDDFKNRVNDVKGHLVGDYYIKEFAMRFQDCIRSSDEASRYKLGDEFAALIKDVGTIEQGMKAAENIYRRLTSEPIRVMMDSNTALPVCSNLVTDDMQIEILEFPVSVSMGIRIYPMDMQDFEDISKLKGDQIPERIVGIDADSAAYHLKKHRDEKPRFKLYGREMPLRSQSKHL